MENNLSASFYLGIEEYGSITKFFDNFLETLADFSPKYKEIIKAEDFDLIFFFILPNVEDVLPEITRFNPMVVWEF